MERISLPISVELLEAVDAARGDVPRTVWIRRAIEARLKPTEGQNQ
jgi:metal-responsive CopG/Arc/MetJ family transcriptional regulator